jgi:hypothetical protein
MINAHNLTQTLSNEARILAEMTLNMSVVG